ncbi:polysaccharide deacetylase family protein [Aliivibrio fischeri]|uniref:polysaccharide deacetylase family protein n=1 Tax=Aliivibrio fischeri TaxID=668 RepID=UPI001F3AD0F2|nr:polysaccharide deacetylase family protein [Aliivibrio fischeri]MCE7576475.1 polysaccharide deacetylase family protein [Aliivibrio fischeri]MCE7588765.1 polysaccharide deacetylase family protein [Aliivibrio fischeri]
MYKLRGSLVSAYLTLLISTSVVASNTPLKKDNVPPSELPPIQIKHTPMFISLGFDDNVEKDGLEWVIKELKKNKNPDGNDRFANLPLSASFFMHCAPARENTEIKELWRQLVTDNHDIGNHTETHPDDKVNYNPLTSWMTPEQWHTEIADCNKLLMAASDNGSLGIEHISGFRAPYMTYNDNTLNALIENNIVYDVSFPAGITPEQNGQNNYWPYTLDNGSPSHNAAVSGWWKPAINNYPGLWEIPLHTLIVPPDELLEQYELNYSLRDKIASRISYFDPISGKGDNFDWNLYSTPNWGAAGLNENDVVAIYKYNLDLRMQGNRAPLILGLHSAFYGYIGGEEHIGMPESNVDTRRNVLKRFIKYALSKPEVRFVNHKQIIDWMRTPEPLTLCPQEEWKPHQVYIKGETVNFQGKMWQAQWWTQLQQPGLTESSPWKKVTSCT